MRERSCVPVTAPSLSISTLPAHARTGAGSGRRSYTETVATNVMPIGLRIRRFEAGDETDAFAAWSVAVEDGGAFPRYPPAELPGSA
jgi:hypothetical protein